MKSILQKYIPEKAMSLIVSLLEKHPIHIKIVNNRKTKHGDFKVSANGKTQITINCGLNKYHFLITLVHEIAHFIVFKKYGNSIKPHGIEWKRHFQHLMLPFLNSDIFPENVLSPLAKYLKNPKASTGSDAHLMRVLNQFNENSDNNYIFELEKGDIFVLKNRKFKLGNKRRTRYECIDLQSKKRYLINENASIKKIKDEK